MKIQQKYDATEEDSYLSLQEIYCNTVLETEEGNQIVVCMRDDTIEFSVVGSDKWYRADMRLGDFYEI